MSSSHPSPFPSPAPRPRWYQIPATQSAPSVWPKVETPIARRKADAALNELLGYKESPSSRAVTYGTVERARAILAGGMVSDSLYASISPSGDGCINIFWKAGRRSIEIELEPGNTHYLRVTDEGGATVLEDQGIGPFPRSAFKSELSKLTKYVDEVNPSWRALFAK